MIIVSIIMVIIITIIIILEIQNPNNFWDLCTALVFLGVSPEIDPFGRFMKK